MKNRAGLLLAAAAVLAANAAALAHVWSNRWTGEPEIALTERELKKAYQEQDNTGVSLNLQRAPSPGFPTETWLDKGKLQELGFDCSIAPDSDAGPGHYRRMLPRPAFVALEFDGPAWQRYLVDLAAWWRRPDMPPKSEVQIEEGREQTQRTSSHLVAIDAARDAATLRRRYPDATRVLIVGAKIRASIGAYYPPAPPPGLTGSIEVFGSEISVPLPFSTQVIEIAGGPNGVQYGEPRYQVRLRFGARREPWVTGITRLR